MEARERQRRAAGAVPFEVGGVGPRTAEVTLHGNLTGAVARLGLAVCVVVEEKSVRLVVRMPPPPTTREPAPSNENVLIDSASVHLVVQEPGGALAAAETVAVGPLVPATRYSVTVHVHADAAAALRHALPFMDVGTAGRILSAPTVSFATPPDVPSAPAAPRTMVAQLVPATAQLYTALASAAATRGTDDGVQAAAVSVSVEYEATAPNGSRVLGYVQSNRTAAAAPLLRQLLTLPSTTATRYQVQRFMDDGRWTAVADLAARDPKHHLDVPPPTGRHQEVGYRVRARNAVGWSAPGAPRFVTLGTTPRGIRVAAQRMGPTPTLIVPPAEKMASPPRRKRPVVYEDAFTRGKPPGMHPRSDDPDSLAHLVDVLGLGFVMGTG